MGTCFCTGACMRGGTCSAFPFGRDYPVNTPSIRGWICPACGSGNAPWASFCGVCAANQGKKNQASDNEGGPYAPGTK